jgi:Sugar phosphate isomerases/epimerases
MNIGIINVLENKGRCFEPVKNFGLDCCQLVSWDISQCSDEIARSAREDAARCGARISAFWAGVPGPAEWNFERGPATLGIVPQQFRAERVAALKRWTRFARALGAPAIVTHAGFLPENATNAEFEPVVAALREVAECCKIHGIEFWFETGQETPVALLRHIQAIGADNVGVNLDPANLLMYGKGNPVDALQVLGGYVRCVHAKDGLQPVDPMQLGCETPIGGGSVNFPLFFRELKRMGYDGDIIIEREISGEQQQRDISESIAKLSQWWSEA